MSYLGVDIGSSQVKAVAFDASGGVLGSAARKYAYSIPESGAMELDGETVRRAAFAVIAECAENVRSVSPVEALAFSSQGEAFCALDGEDRILGPAMISGDSRATAVMDDFVRSFGRDGLYRITGHTPSGMFSLAKLLWMKRFRPEWMCRATHFFCFEDLLTHSLCGRAAMGRSLAGRTMLYYVVRHGWSPEILSAAGIGSSALADVVPSGTVVGEVRADRARELHLNAHIPVVAGGHDQVIGAVGCGAGRRGFAGPRAGGGGGGGAA